MGFERIHHRVTEKIERFRLEKQRNRMHRMEEDAAGCIYGYLTHNIICHCDEPHFGEEAISTINEIASLRSQ